MQNAECHYTAVPIETKRLVLRWMKVEDASSYHALLNDPEVMKHLDGVKNRSPEDYQSSIAKRPPGLDNPFFAVTLRVTQEFVGCCGFVPFAKDELCGEWQIYIILERRCWQPDEQKYGAEVGVELLRWGFHALERPRLFGLVAPGNVRSISLCKKLGMKRNGTMRRTSQHIYCIEEKDLQKKGLNP